MTFDDMLDAYANDDELPATAIAAALADWDACGSRHRALLDGYVTGADLSERTERAMLVVTHLLAEQEDTASFPLLCTLAHDTERLESALGEDAIGLSYKSMLISTFGGDLRPLHDLVEQPGGDDLARADALMVLAFLTRTGRVAERTAYDYLAALPARLAAEPGAPVWSGYAQAVAALGFAGLAGTVEGLFARGTASTEWMTPEDFWADLRWSQQDGQDFSNPAWSGCEPAGSAIDRLRALLEGTEPMPPGEVAAEPIRNPLRTVGRNDPCPCGSGRKYKKCCLAA